MADWSRTALLWGAGTLIWIGGLVAVGPIAGGSTVGYLTTIVVDATPGTISTFAITTFGSTALLLVVASLGLGAVFGGALTGVVMERRGFDAVVYRGLGVFVALASALVLLGVSGSTSGGWLLATVLALVPPGLLVWVPKRRPAVTGRRQVLAGFGTAASAIVGIGATTSAIDRRWAESGPSPGESLSPVEEKTAVGTTTPAGPTATVTEPAAQTETEQAPPTLAGPSGDAAPAEESQTENAEQRVTISTLDSGEPFSVAFEGMPKAVGPASAHYVVDKNVTNPDIDASEWSLDVEGAVDSSYSLSFDELIDHPDARDMTVTTVCISNPVGGRLIGTAEWQAVPVRTLLDEAGVEEDAFDVVTKAADGYSESLPWSVVRNREDIVIAFGMNGKSLPREHGFPARLLVPGRYGMKSTKWVESIEVSRDDRESYWESRGWVEEGVVNPLSYIRAVQRRGDRVAIGGIAYAGVQGVDTVEVSLDDGDTWTEATLEATISPHAWRRWYHVVERPPDSQITATVRTIDGNGAVQTAEESPAHPGGSTGWHRIAFTT